MEKLKSHPTRENIFINQEDVLKFNGLLSEAERVYLVLKLYLDPFRFSYSIVFFHAGRYCNGTKLLMIKK